MPPDDGRLSLITALTGGAVKTQKKRFPVLLQSNNIKILCSQITQTESSIFYVQTAVTSTFSPEKRFPPNIVPFIGPAFGTGRLLKPKCGKRAKKSD